MFKRQNRAGGFITLLPLLAAASLSKGQESSPSSAGGEARWNWHVQNTDIVQYHPGFRADYSGPNSLRTTSEVKETVSLDVLFGLRLWRGGEFHIDGLMWQGFGFSQTLGAEAFPNGEAFRLGTEVPNVNLSRVFIRQTFGLGGEQEEVQDDALQLAGRRDVARVTLTLGRMSAKDIFDNNRYANDPRTQFMSWSLMANEAWDYPADSLGYMTGFAADLNLPEWALRYGFFQMPRVSNGTALDSHFAEAWGMVSELERRFSLAGKPGAVRLLGFVNRAHMGSYRAAVADSARPADIRGTREYRLKFGAGINVEQEISKNLGTFARLGWSDGQTEGWTFADVDRTANGGVSIKGEAWRRPDDTLAIAGGVNGASGAHREFLAAGGTGILAGDGALHYAVERFIEAYYAFPLFRNAYASLDYQSIFNPAFNRDRGPVSVFSARLHWAY